MLNMQRQEWILVQAYKGAINSTLNIREKYMKKIDLKKLKDQIASVLKKNGKRKKGDAI